MRGRQVLGIVVLVVAIAGLGWWWLGRDDGPAAGSTYEITVTKADGCDIAQPVEVAGQTWESTSLWPETWGTSVSGDLRIQDDHTATFEGDGGIPISFTRQQGRFSDLGCPLLPG